jgi:hypothetical protein
MPFADYRKQPGDRVGHHWRISQCAGQAGSPPCALRHQLLEVFRARRLAVPMGDRGCLSLFGDKPESHRLFAEHLSAEYRVKTEGRGRTVDEWKQRPERGDNHWFDALVGLRGGCIDSGRDLGRLAARQAAHAPEDHAEGMAAAEKLQLSEQQMGRMWMPGGEAA